MMWIFRGYAGGDWQSMGKATTVFLHVSYYCSAVGVTKAQHIVGQMYFY